MIIKKSEKNPKKYTIKMSKKEWIAIGKKGNWLKTSQRTENWEADRDALEDSRDDYNHINENHIKDLFNNWDKKEVHGDFITFSYSYGDSGIGKFSVFVPEEEGETIEQIYNYHKHRTPGLTGANLKKNIFGCRYSINDGQSQWFIGESPEDAYYDAFLDFKEYYKDLN